MPLPTNFSFSRMIAVLRKEFFQMRRDPVSIGIMMIIPLLQLILFGYAINTNPKYLPTALVSSDNSVLTRTFVRAIENTEYFRVTYQPKSIQEADKLLAVGKVLFVVTIPSDFTTRFFRGENPQILIQADATDSVAVTSAVTAMQQIMPHVFDRWLTGNLANLKQPKLTVNY